MRKYTSQALLARVSVLPQTRPTGTLSASGPSSSSQDSFKIETDEWVWSRLGKLFSVGNPDVFHLHGVIEEPAAFALFHVKPVYGAALVGEHLLQVSN
jgi:hypothetical protein